MKIPCCRKKKETPHCSAVIVAAGSSQRMGSDKLLHNLGIMPVLARTLLAFQDCELVDEIVVVTRMEKIVEVAGLCKKYRIDKASKVISGGATRMESALAGVSEVKKRARLIAIHDGARPLVSVDLIEKTVRAAAEFKAAVPAVKSVDTLKLVEDAGRLRGIPRRERSIPGPSVQGLPRHGQPGRHAERQQGPLLPAEQQKAGSRGRGRPRTLEGTCQRDHLSDDGRPPLRHGLLRRPQY